MPTAGGTEAALHKPRRPVKMSRYRGVVAKLAIREEREKAARAKRRRGRRPKVSASLAKKRRNAPELRLYLKVSIYLFLRYLMKRDRDEEKKGTYEAEALIHVISALLMFKSRPIGAVITVQIPYKNEEVPIDIVAVRTKRHSWMVVGKHAGLLPASACCSRGADGSSRFVSSSAMVASQGNYELSLYM